MIRLSVRPRPGFPIPAQGVWVSAVDATGTIAKSDPLEIEILKPRLDLAFEPRAPMVGQEVKARLTVQPEVRSTSAGCPYPATPNIP